MPTSSLSAHRRAAGLLTCAAAGLIALSFACTQKPAGPTRPADQPVAATPAEKPIAEAPTSVASCVSCHENLEKEMLTRVHARKGKSCTDCHGQSTAHAAGGSPQPLPDHTFTGNEIDTFCTQCHHRHDQEMLARAVQRRQGRNSPHGQPITLESHCTDCHGQHVNKS